MLVKAAWQRSDTKARTGFWHTYVPNAFRGSLDKEVGSVVTELSDNYACTAELGNKFEISEDPKFYRRLCM